MEVIPAVDIMGGRVVRLYRGDPNRTKVYYNNPLDAARRWIGEGAKTIHVVDLDAALSLGENTKLIEQMVSTLGVRMQIGGGIRSVEKAERLIKAGAEMIIVGTRALRDRAFTKELADRYGPERVAVALDYSEGEVLIEGWKSRSGRTLREMIGEVKVQGIRYILLTSRERDGTLTGPDYRTIKGASEEVDIKVMAAGGIESIEHILKLKASGAYAAILGRCLYEGTLELGEAIKAAEEG